MPITLIVSLALVALRLDALTALARAAASLPSLGGRRTIDYRALANAEATDAQRLMRAARVPPADRGIAAADARLSASRVTRSLDVAVRFTAHPERTDAITCTVLCDGCKRHPVATTYSALRRGLRTLCETCLHDAAEHLFDPVAVSSASTSELEHAPACSVPDCDCELTTSRPCTGCNGYGEVPGRWSNDPADFRICARCKGEGVEPSEEPVCPCDEPSIGGCYAGVA